MDTLEALYVNLLLLALLAKYFRHYLYRNLQTRLIECMLVFLVRCDRGGAPLACDSGHG
jgi:hypothetical protein